MMTDSKFFSQKIYFQLKIHYYDTLHLCTASIYAEKSDMISRMI